MILNQLIPLSLLLLSGIDFTLAKDGDISFPTTNKTYPEFPESPWAPANFSPPSINSSRLGQVDPVSLDDDPNSPLNKAKERMSREGRKKYADMSTTFEPRRPDLDKPDDDLLPRDAAGFPKYPVLLVELLRSIEVYLWMIHDNVGPELSNYTFSAASHWTNLLKNQGTSNESPFTVRDYYYMKGMEHVQIVAQVLLDFRRGRLLENWLTITNVVFLLLHNQLVLLGLLLGPYDPGNPGPKHLAHKPWEAIETLVDLLVADNKEVYLDLFGNYMLWRPLRYRALYLWSWRGSATWDEEHHLDHDPSD
ncbi:hypothetical protein CP532_3489, partial [Ophiocordyceps camponoti-leonardi (nom. inval.)]